LGDWVIIKLPNPILLTKFRIYAKIKLFVDRAPSLWRCYGSKDGITFTEITEASNNVSALTSTNYQSNVYEKSLASSFNTEYQYIGFTINKLVGGTNSILFNFAELQIFGKELIVKVKPLYISFNVIPNTLSPYDKIIDTENAITGF
jgi:hypothetical protein